MANDVCTFDAQQNMKLYQLLEVVENNADCTEAATKYFEKNYAHQLFKFVQQDQAATINMMKHFGHLITQAALHINFCLPYPDDSFERETERLIAAIDTYLRKSLVEFSVTYNGCNRYNLFDQIRGPFQSLTILSLELSRMSEQVNKRQLDAFFPNVQQLDINTQYLIDSSFISNLPKLTHLGIGAGFIFDSPNLAGFTNLLSTNPQITYLSLVYPTFEALQEVKKYSKNLYEMHVVLNEQKRFHPEIINHNSEVHFPTVKIVNVMLPYESHPVHELVFSKSALRSLTIFGDPGKENDDYINFLVKYPRIQQLKAGFNLNDVHLSKLSGKFPRMFYAEFDFTKDINANSIIKFVKNSPSLNQMKFEYKNVEQFDPFKRQLQNGLGAEFDITTSDLESKTKLIEIIRRKFVPHHEAYITDSDSAAHRSSTSVILNTFVVFAIVYATRFLLI